MPRHVITLLLLATLVAAWAFLLLPTSLGGPASYIIASGVSMEPTLDSGDLVVLRRGQSYQPGDIVGFRVRGGIVIHRIVGGSAEEGFLTQGDNKEGTDPWQPRPGDILGRMWCRLPGAGRLIISLRSRPLSLLGLTGAIALAALHEPQAKRQRKRRWRMRFRPAASKTARHIDGLLAVLALSLLVGLASAAGAVYCFRQPTERAEAVERLRYEHTAAFNYTVHTAPSNLYTGDVVGPIGPAEPGGAATVTSSPVMRELARSVDLSFAYLLKSSQPADLEGEIAASLLIKAGKGWTKTIDLLPPKPFAGAEASTQLSLDLAQIAALIDTIEEETQYDPGSYEVSLVPKVRLRGHIGQQAIDDTYEPAFRIGLDRRQITMDPAVGRSEVRTVTEEEIRPQRVGLLRLSLPVTVARRLSLAGAALGALASAVVASVLFLGLGSGEVARIRIRYGSMLVSVARVEADYSPKIEVASMSDLVRLARHQGSMICHQERAPGAHLYFVHDGQVTYQHCVSEPIGKEDGAHAP